jgi:hypothetical protein
MPRLSKLDLPRARPFIDWLKSLRGQEGKFDLAGGLPDEIYDRAIEEVEDRRRIAEEIKLQELKRDTGK